MKKIKDLFTGKAISGAVWFENNEMLVLLLMLLSCVFSNILGKGSNFFSFIIFASFLWMFVFSCWDTLCAAYLMLTFWDNRMYLIGVTLPLITVLKLMLALKTFLSLKQIRIKLHLIDILTFAMLFIFALVSILLERRFTGVSMFLDVVFILYCVNIKKENAGERSEIFWKKVFFALFLTTIGCMAVGYFEFFFKDEFKTVIMFGEKYKRFRGVIGIDRFCMLASFAAIFPLYYMENKTLKTGSIFVLIVSSLLTISLTALLCMGAFVITYAVMNYKEKNKLWIALIGLAMIIYIIYLWRHGSSISFINVMVLRVKKMALALVDGNISSATTGRTNLVNESLQLFSNVNVFNKLFGTGIISQYSAGNLQKYSHNSYIDILLYMGVVGLLVVLARFVQSIREIKSVELRQQIILMKLSTAIIGLSVSAMTADYWLIFFLI